MVNLEGMTMKELREIARSYGIATSASGARPTWSASSTRPTSGAITWLPEGKRVVGYFLDGTPILEDAKKQGS